MTDRIETLNELIQNQFGEMDMFRPEGVENYESSQSIMIEVLQVRVDGAIVEGFDLPMAPTLVRFPLRIHQWLQPGDVFLCTLGYQESSCDIIYLSPAYEAVEYDFDFDEEELH